MSFLFSHSIYLIEKKIFLYIKTQFLAATLCSLQSTATISSNDEAFSHKNPIYIKSPKLSPNRQSMTIFPYYATLEAIVGDFSRNLSLPMVMCCSMVCQAHHPGRSHQCHQLPDLLRNETASKIFKLKIRELEIE